MKEGEKIKCGHGVLDLNTNLMENISSDDCKL